MKSRSRILYHIPLTTRKVLIKRITSHSLPYLIFIFLIPNLHAENRGYAEILGGIVGGSFDQGYDASGTSTSTGVTINTTNGYALGDMYGIGLGGRFGAEIGDYFFLAGDGRYDYTSIEQLINVGNNKTYNASNLSLGGIAGLKYGWFSVWGGYSPVDVMVIMDDKSNHNDYSGNSYKVGIGYRGTQYGFNIELTNATYDMRDKKNLPTTYVSDGLTITEKKMTVTKVLLSLSLFQFL